MRGKIVERDGQLSVGLPGETLPESLRARLRAGEITRVFVIGQGTAAVAGQSLAAALSTAARSRFAVEALPATELSGFRLGDDMSDALVVAISQSGTTTDTNRTVDLARARGAAVVGIVNRRNSDLVDKADGVLFTSDGRDVEMSVASTKAFYAQIAAGLLLALTLAGEAGVLDAAWAHEVLTAMRELPDAMELVVDHREEIAAIAAAPRAVTALLGRRRERQQPHRGAGASHQAVRALLQVDRVRRHRRQEAHRPVVRAAHPRLRGRLDRLQRRRRGQGARDLPGAQGGADRDHDGG